LTSEDKQQLLIDFNIDENSMMWEFNNWVWNPNNQRLESPDGTKWISYTKTGTEYQMNQLN